MNHHNHRRGERRPRRRPPKGVVRPLPPIDITPQTPPPVEEKPEPPQEMVAAEPPPSPPPPRAPGGDLWLVTVLVMLAMVPFLTALSGDFVWEDRALIVEGHFARGPASVIAILGSPFLAARPNSYHPLATLTYLTDFLVWRSNPVGYHSTNLTLHLIATLLVYVVAWQLLRRRAMAFAAGAIFAVHPVHAQSVAWIAARPQLLGTCLALFALLAYAYYIESFPDPSKPRRRTPAYYWLSLVAFALALFAHAAAAALLVLLPLYEITLDRRRLDARKGMRVLTPYIGFAAAGVLYLLARWWALGYQLAVGFDIREWPAYLVTAPLTAVRAFELLLLPVRSRPYFPIQLLQSPLRVDFITATAAMVVLVIVAVRLRSVSAAAAFAAWWALLTLAPALDLLPLMTPEFAERDLYLPSAGTAILVGWAAVGATDVMAARRRQRVRSFIIIIYALVIAACIPVSWARAGWYHDEVSLFQRMAQTTPGSAMTHFNLGNAYLEGGEFGKAVAEYRRSIALRPSAKAYHNLGNALIANRQYREAAEAYGTALSLNPGSVATSEGLEQALQAQAAQENPSKTKGPPPNSKGR